MRFLLGCEVSPSSPFGLPDGDVLVLPAPGGQFIGPSVHSRAGVVFSRGTLPVYRQVESRLETQSTVDGTRLRFVDNALEVHFEASDRSSALDVGLDIVDRFLQRLALEHGRRFSARPLFLEDGLQSLLSLPIALFRGTVTVFDLEVLKGQIESAATTLEVHDEVLQKALDYYEHALFLSAAAPEPDGMKASHRTASHLLAAAFLFLWKALSVIVGDPNVDNDYQSRYRRLGLDYAFFAGTIEKIRRLRNAEDVAHYRVDNEGIVTLKEQFGASRVAVRTVIKAYIAMQSKPQGTIASDT
jgi:hypothetical protein